MAGDEGADKPIGKPFWKAEMLIGAIQHPIDCGPREYRPDRLGVRTQRLTQHQPCI
jgi:hypothetical protein